MQDQRYSNSKFDKLKYVTLKGVKTSSKKSPQQMATRIDGKNCHHNLHQNCRKSFVAPKKRKREK